MSFNFAKFPILSTKRLILRQITMEDSESIFFLRTDKEVNKYIYRPNPHQTIKEAEEFINKTIIGMQKGENINWGITAHSNDELIGSICLWNFSPDRKKAEIGYDLKPDFHNQGLMSEAIHCVVDFGFKKLDLVQIEAYTHSENESSRRLLLKNNFSLSKKRKDQETPNNIIFELKNKADNNG